MSEVQTHILSAGTSDGESRSGSAVLQFALLALVAALAFPSAIASMAGLWLRSSSYHHGAAAIPLAAWLIWRDRGALTAPAPSLLAAAMIAPVSALWVAGRAFGANIVEHFAFISILITSFATIFGLDNARRAAFGLLFLFFAVPFGESLMPALQSLAAGVVAPMLTASGVALVKDGVLLHTSVGRFEIADACAGLNFLLAALLIAAVFAGVAFRSWRKRLAFLAAAAVMALLANLLRAYLVILLAVKTPLGMDFARDHAWFGWSLYAVFLFVLIAIGRRLRDDTTARVTGGGALSAPTPLSRPLILAALLMALAGAIGAFGLPEAPHLTTSP